MTSIFICSAIFHAAYDGPDCSFLSAGIIKHITFHCARHTYATLQLTFGTDIYTVSKLLGHKHLKTTEVYAKVIDHKKQEAANRIQLVF